MDKLNYELLETESPFDYAMTKWPFRQAFWVLLGFFVIGTPAIGIINCLIERWASVWAFMYSGFALAAVMFIALHFYKAKNRDKAIEMLILFGKCAEMYVLLKEDASEEQRAFLLCLEGLERGRGRLWLMG